MRYDKMIDADNFLVFVPDSLGRGERGRHVFVLRAGVFDRYKNNRRKCLNAHVRSLWLQGHHRQLTRYVNDIYIPLVGSLFTGCGHRHKPVLESVYGKTPNESRPQKSRESSQNKIQSGAKALCGASDHQRVVSGARAMGGKS